MGTSTNDGYRGVGILVKDGRCKEITATSSGTLVGREVISKEEDFHEVIL